MKKAIVILLMLFMIPNVILAKCDSNKHKEGIESAKNITHDVDYNSSKGKFTLTLYNVDEGMYALYNNVRYNQKNEKIVISNLSEGTNVTVDVYISDGCDSPIDSIKVPIPYYNLFYGSAKCHDYKNILTMCSSEFTTFKVTSEILDLAINNYNTQRIEVPVEDKPIEEIEPTFFEKLEDFSNTWGLKIALFLSSGMITYIIGSSKLRKVKHGV